MSVRLAEASDGCSLPAYDQALLLARAQALLQRLGRGDAELSLALVDDPSMADMNERYRGRSGPTDVLSFSLLEGEGAEHRGGLLGDVVIDLQQAERQAIDIGHGIDAELARLLIHGVLHLLGYDHEQPEQAREMEALEGSLWDAIVT